VRSHRPHGDADARWWKCGEPRSRAIQPRRLRNLVGMKNGSPVLLPGGAAVGAALGPRAIPLGLAAATANRCGWRWRGGHSFAGILMFMQLGSAPGLFDASVTIHKESTPICSDSPRTIKLGQHVRAFRGGRLVQSPRDSEWQGSRR